MPEQSSMPSTHSTEMPPELARRRLQELLDRLERLTSADPHDWYRLADEALSIAQQLGDRQAEAHARAYLGFSEYVRSNFEGALDLLRGALKIAEEIGDIFGRARILSGLAGVYSSLGNLDLALESALTALRVLEQKGETGFVGWALYGIGTGFYDLGDLVQAREHFERSIDLFRRVDHAIGLARATVGLSLVDLDEGKLDAAEAGASEAHRLFSKNGNLLGISRAIHDLGRVAEARGDFEAALTHFDESLAMRQKHGFRSAETTSQLSRGRALLHLGRYEDALEPFRAALAIAETSSLRIRLYQAHEGLAQAFEAMEQPTEALTHLRKYQQFKDAVFSDQMNARLRNLQTGYEVAKAEQQAEIERLRNIELKSTNDRLTQLLAELQATQAQLVQSEKMAALGDLIAGFVHEINNPVGAIKASSDVLDRASQRLSDPDRRGSVGPILNENIAVVRDATERLSHLVTSLKTFIRLDSAERQMVDINEGAAATLDVLEPHFGTGITIVREFGDLPRVPCHGGDINSVMMHLLTNAAAAIGDHGTIRMKTWSADRSAFVMVADTGKGISAEQLGELFQPQFSRTGERVKAGLGLFTSQQIARRHGGQITVASEEGRGSQFTLRLPLSI